MKKKFSKALLIEVLNSRIETMKKINKLNPNNGWAQVDKKGEAANREYGKFSTLIDLRDEIEGGYLSL
jgi:hypothetical protein